MFPAASFCHPPRKHHLPSRPSLLDSSAISQFVMSAFSLRSTHDITPTSSISDISDNRCMNRINDSARLISSTSHGYFWDVEEIRHQEHLHRVSHAQYLYRHRHDSNEAARMYRSFMTEQNQWMDEQERMKEIESTLSMRAYQQRASRWEEEWVRLQEGSEVEDILKVIRHDYLSYSL